MSTPILEAGQLRHRITIEAATDSRDAHGGITRSWAWEADRWAKVEPVSGEEFYRARQVGSAITHRVRLRHFPGLTTHHRIRFGSRVLRIESVINVEERDIETRIEAREEPDHG